MKHDWRALLQYKLTDDEARKMVKGYGHPEVDEAPIGVIAAGEKPPVGDPRVFLGPHNLIQENTVVVCWNCEQAWDSTIADVECLGESVFGEGPLLNQLDGAGNVPGHFGGVGRNEPCPCGSGEKFKRCHGAN
jgi:SEC-C motif